MSSSENRVFTPAKAAFGPLITDLVQEESVEPKYQLSSWAEDYALFFVNAMHMYLRIPVSLFELYAKQFNRKLNITHFTMPQPLLVEDVVMPKSFLPPEPGWSRYLHGMPKEQWQEFRDWMTSSKWMASDAKRNKVLYSCEAEDIKVRDPVKLQTMQVVGIKEFVPMTFFLPSNPAGRLYLNLKNGPPFSCVYVSRSSAGAGEAAALFQKMRGVQ